MSDTPPLSTLHAALTALDELAGTPEGLGVRALSRILELPKSTAHRILATLEGAGYVRQQSGELYVLGPKILEIAARWSAGLDVRRLARPHLEALQVRAGETAFLAVLDGIEAVIVDMVHSPQPLRMTSEVGAREPAHATALGKVLLAFAGVEPPSKVTRRTNHTITDPKQLTAEFGRVRARGYALDDEEYLEGVRCVAAPVLDAEGACIAAVSVSGPSFRIPRSRVRSLAREVRAAADEISAELGSATSASSSAT